MISQEQKIEEIVIVKDKEEALRYLAALLEWIKGHPGFACGYRPFK
ncbi:MAG: hypothetical protein JRI57_00410 [Deltaproteobacteria bacterium]|nr:hypothetical protein [Deltaproteobacteria bacterium]